jgi:hypothetical protein
MNTHQQIQKIGIDDWSADQDIEYTLVAKVNDQVAFELSSADLDIIEGELIHAEEEVAKLLNDQYIDATCPEYWSNEDEIYNV